MSTDQPPRKSTRHAILDAAAFLLAKQGPSIKMEEIARQASVSRQSLYVHFASRTGLLVALAQHVDAGGMLDGLVEQVTSAPSALRALDAIAHLHAEYSPVAYPVARVFMAGRQDDEALKVAWDDRMQGRRHLYQYVVHRLEHEGHLAPGWDTEDATNMLSALASWQVWEQLVIEQGWSKERYRRHIERALRGTLVRNPSVADS